MIETLQELTFEIGGYLGTTFSIKLSKGKAMYGSSSYHPPIFEEHKHFDKSKVEKLIDDLNEIDVHSWEREYNNSMVIDGFYWEFYMMFNQGQIKRVYGSNAFPE